jgi:hypothetical protein
MNPFTVRAFIVLGSLGALLAFCVWIWSEYQNWQNKPPKDVSRYHSQECGTMYRGCSPKCPVNKYWESGVWLGIKRFRGIRLVVDFDMTFPRGGRK